MIETMTDKEVTGHNVQRESVEPESGRRLLQEDLNQTVSLLPMSTGKVMYSQNITTTTTTIDISDHIDYLLLFISFFVCNKFCR